MEMTADTLAGTTGFCARVLAEGVRNRQFLCGESAVNIK